MDEIKLNITIPNNVAYPRIVLRKFFYMIFIDANGRKLYAYIASVFGGITKEIDDADEAYKNIKYTPGQECALKFEIESNNQIVEKIVTNDLTDKFFRQTEHIEKVWGECSTLNNQEEVNAALKELYPELYEPPKYATINVSNSNKIILIKDKDNKPSHNCIVTRGIFKSNSNTPNLYELYCPVPSSGGCIDGLEAMNWIKVEIDLKRNILEEPVLFSILLDKGRIFSPDFTWYFAPPLGTVISADSYVKIGEERVNNVLQGVSDETTVLFDEWTEPPESISERKKSRVLFKSHEIATIVACNKLSEKETLSVSLHLENPQEPSNKQFLSGLFIAFLLSFCSDKTRINDYYKCLHKGCTCVDKVCRCQTICNIITIVAPILLIMCFFSLVLTPKKTLPSVGKKKRLSLLLARGIGIISMFVLMIYVFFLWLVFPEFMRTNISCQINQLVLMIGACISSITNMIYLLYCTIVLKRKIFNYI